MVRVASLFGQLIQMFTRQDCQPAVRRNLLIKTCVGTTVNSLKIPIGTALIAFLPIEETPPCLLAH